MKVVNNLTTSPPLEKDQEEMKDWLESIGIELMELNSKNVVK